MAGILSRREDGTTFLTINGDLQFDSADERIYHEGLALPSLALAIERIKRPLKVLVIGGGDGLIVRELLRCAGQQLHSIDLVDYDPEIVGYARNELCELNQSSLHDRRTHVHIEDAWTFVERAIASGAKYDLIVSDLTVAEDLTGAKFHSID
ncbi:MAG TPA: hypothetical protein V6C72_03400, partial [Chroococcales cyanobacterium]